MVATTTNKNMQEFYNTLFEMSLNHRIELKGNDLLDYIKAVDMYNKFDAENVCEMVSAINNIMPKPNYGENNPNTGKIDHKYSFGREYSPVLYIEFNLCHSVNAYKGQNMKTLFESTQSGIARLKQIERAARSIGQCDEFDVEYSQGNDWESISIRIWWD